MHRLKSVLAVLGAAVILVLAANTVSVAATGKAFLLGKVNRASTPTTLTRTTSGSVLSLKSKTAAAAPLTVNGRGRVANLNADSVDGYDSAALRDRAWVWTRKIPLASASKRFDLALTGLPAGAYVIGYSGYPGFDGTLPDKAAFTCYLSKMQNGFPVSYYAEDSTHSFDGTAVATSGTAIIEIGSGESVQFTCASTFNFYAYSTQPMQVWASPIAVVSRSSNLRSLPSGARSKP